MPSAEGQATKGLNNLDDWDGSFRRCMSMRFGGVKGADFDGAGIAGGLCMW